ncbi:hypothetical protein Tco_0948470, partial [Tanacetum coccineum]
MFDEYFTPTPIAITPVQEVIALRAVDLADYPVQLPLTRMLHHQVLHQHKNKNNLQKFLK